MAEHQSPLRSESGVGHVKQHHSVEGVGTGGHHNGPLGQTPHAEQHHINMKSHPYEGKRGHIQHFKEHGHMGGSAHCFPGRRK
jgi:hypothetical protein